MNGAYRSFDCMIGRTDRMLSEFLGFAKLGTKGLDEYDKHTMEHHAEDMIGAGVRALELLGSKVPDYLLDKIEALKIPPSNKVSPSVTTGICIANRPVKETDGSPQ